MKRMKSLCLAIVIIMILPVYTLAVPGKSQADRIKKIRDVTITPPPTPTEPPATTTPTPESTTSGEHIYIAQDGAATNIGASCLTARPVSWLNTAANWGDGSGKVSAGDMVHLCGVITERIFILGNGLLGKPVTITFEPGAKLSSPVWSATGAIYARDKQFIVVDGAGNGKIENTNNGTNFQNQLNSAGVVLSNCQHCEVKGLNVSNIYQMNPSSSDSKGSGIGIKLIGNSSNSSVHDCVISSARAGIGVHYTPSKSSNVSVYNNIIIRTSHGIQVGDTNIGAVAENINIYNNRIFDNYVWDIAWVTATTTGHYHSNGVFAWCAHTGSSLNGINVFNNDIGPNLGTHVTGWIYVSGPGITNVNIYNNLLTATGTSYAANAYIIIANSVGIKVYSNTISASGVGNGVMIRHAFGSADIRNNIINKTYTGVCFYGADTTGLIVANRNNYYGIGRGGMYYQTRFYKLTEWQSLLGFDRDSVTTDPFLSVDFHPASNSPVRGIGDYLGAPYNKDKVGVDRPASGWTLGCYQ